MAPKPAAATAPIALTVLDIEATIASEEFLQPASAPGLTLCVMTLKNGFALVGQSRPIDIRNFSEAQGRNLARADAIRQIWPLEGYRLRSALTISDVEG